MNASPRALAAAALVVTIGAGVAVTLAQEPAAAPALPTKAKVPVAAQPAAPPSALHPPTAAAPTAAAPTAAAPGAATEAARDPAAAPAASADGDAEAARRGQVLASFDGGKVTVGDMEDAIAEQSPFMRKRYAKDENRTALLDKLIRFALLAQEAQTRGYGEDPVVVQAVKQNSVQRLMKTEFDDKITAKTIPIADVQKYYDDNLSEFVRPATRRASHVLVATEEEAKALIKESTGLDMRGFRQLAREKSLDEETKLRGGDLRYMDPEGRLQGEEVARLPKELADALFALKNVGDVAKKPIKVTGGYSVVKLTGIRPANERSLEEAQDTIRARLWRERRKDAIDAFVTRLRTELKPEVHPELVSAIRFDPAKDAPSASGIPSGFPANKALEGTAH